MGKLHIPPDVDLENATIAGVLKQIKRSNTEKENLDTPTLILTWACLISPKDTKRLIKLMEKITEAGDPIDLSHVKRFRKRENSQPIVIDTIICSTEFMSSKILLLEFLKSCEPETFSTESIIETIRVPKYLPPTKEIAIDWSNRFWPMAWRGNPNHQALLTTKFDIPWERSVIELLQGSQKSSLPATIITGEDPMTHEQKILCIAGDERSTHPLKHSIMNAIATIADTEIDERHRSSVNESSAMGYLCHNLSVYTTHEPCTMCAMALVHSRIGRLVYLSRHPCGAVESSHFIGDRNDLNWTFDVWRWIEVGSKNRDPLDSTTLP